MAVVKAVQVNLFGQFVGAVAPLRGKPGFYEFSYAPDFRKSGLEIAPVKMKLNAAKNRFSFPELASPQISRPLNGTGIFGWQNG